MTNTTNKYQKTWLFAMPVIMFFGNIGLFFLSLLVLEDDSYFVIPIIFLAIPVINTLIYKYKIAPKEKPLKILSLALLTSSYVVGIGALYLYLKLFYSDIFKFLQ